jgi:hypothetical protein
MEITHVNQKKMYLLGRKPYFLSSADPAAALAVGRKTHVP